MDTTLFCNLLEISKADFKKFLNKDWSSTRFNKSTAFTFLSKIEPITFARFQEHLYKFPGFTPQIRNIRAYPFPNAAHVLGYLAEADNEIINNSEGVYSMGDFVGRTGLEKKYEASLKGTKGVKFITKDVMGREVGSYNDGLLDNEAVTGDDLYTTLDQRLQEYGELLMQNKRGSIVAIEPSTGEILSCVSAPSYDPNLLTLERGRGKAFISLSQDSINKINKPLMDRSVLAKYPPGSIFKPIFSLIALQEGVSHSGRHITCNGEYVINEKKGFKQKCHAHPSATNISTAIQHSCNTYYYQLMREFIEKHGYNYPGRGLNDLSKYLVEFGLGRKLGVDYELESTGFIPTSDYYDNQYNYVRSGWKSTYILSLGIGQGELQLTTLQMANLAAILGNRGHYYIPHFVKKPTASFDPIYEEPQRVSIDDKHFDPVVWGMQKVITSGTAQNAKIPGFSSAGKTGTSQNPHGKDHSVFFAFAPAVNPKIAIAVYVENAGFGGTVAAPIASLMMENYLNDFEGIKRPLLEKSMIDLDLISNP